MWARTTVGFKTSTDLFKPTGSAGKCQERKEIGVAETSPVAQSVNPPTVGSLGWSGLEDPEKEINHSVSYRKISGQKGLVATAHGLQRVEHNGDHHHTIIWAQCGHPAAAGPWATLPIEDWRWWSTCDLNLLLAKCEDLSNSFQAAGSCVLSHRLVRFAICRDSIFCEWRGDLRVCEESYHLLHHLGGKSGRCGRRTGLSLRCAERSSSAATSRGSWAGRHRALAIGGLPKRLSGFWATAICLFASAEAGREWMRLSSPMLNTSIPVFLLRRENLRRAIVSQMPGARLGFQERKRSWGWSDRSGDAAWLYLPVGEERRRYMEARSGISLMTCVTEAKALKRRP